MIPPGSGPPPALPHLGKLRPEHHGVLPDLRSARASHVRWVASKRLQAYLCLWDCCHLYFTLSGLPEPMVQSQPPLNLGTTPAGLQRPRRVLLQALGFLPDPSPHLGSGAPPRPRPSPVYCADPLPGMADTGSVSLNQNKGLNNVTPSPLTS